MRPSARAIDWPSDVLPTPGGPTKQRIGPEVSFLSFDDGEVLEDPLLDLLEVEVVLVEHLRALSRSRLSVVVLSHGSVRIQSRYVRMTPYSAAAVGQLLEPCQLAVDGLAHVFGQLASLEALAQLRELGRLRVALAELVLDRLQLLAQEVLALPLLHLRLYLRLDLRAELEDLELAVQDRRDVAQPRLDVGQLEQPLLLVGLQPQGRRDEVAERARIVDVRRGELQLFGQIRYEADHAREEVLHVAGERLHLGRLLELVRQLGELADEVRVVLRRPFELDASQPLDEDPQRPVGDPDHLVDHGGGADLVQVVPAGLLGVRVLDGDEREHALAGDDVLDELDRAFLPDRERRHRFGKTTVSLSGSTGSVAGKVSSSSRSSRTVSVSASLTSVGHHDRDALGRRRLRRDRELDRQQASLVRGGRRLGVDVLGERHLALEGAVLDLELLVLPASLGRCRSPAMRSACGEATTFTWLGSTPGSSTTTVSAGGPSVR